MQPPRLIGAWPRATLAAERTALGRARYSLTYELQAEPGACALQRVETRVQYLRGDEPLVEYQAVYWEWFRFAPEGRERRLDLHDFELTRDGWSPDRIARLLRHHGLEPGPGGPSGLRLEKRFLLGPGALTEERAAHRTPAGGEFGYLEAAEGEAAWLRLRLGPEGREVMDAALPLPGPAAGRATFLAGPRLAAGEELEFGFATLSGELRRRAYAAEAAPSGGLL